MGFYGGGFAGPSEDTRGRTLVVAANNSTDPTLAPAVYRCDGVNDQVEINAAITAMGAVGGTVILLEGTYNITASINLASLIALVGQGAGTVLRVPNGHNADLNVISASNVNRVLIADLRIDGNRANQAAGNMYGVYFSSVAYSKIVNCWVENMYGQTGIYLDSSSNNTVTGNTVTGNDIGIRLYGSSNNNTISGNTCLGNGDGILLYGSSNNTVTGNTCLGNGDGIYLDSSSNNNTISGNTVMDNNIGIRLYVSSNNTVTGNTCQGNNLDGILLNGSSNNTVTGNTCQGNTRDGISLINDSSNNTVTGNTCQGNAREGILLNDSSNNTVTGNTCQGNAREGILLNGSSNNNTISGNTVTGNSQLADNSYDGINLEDSDYNNMQGNTVRHGGGAKQHRYGIRINNAACDGNLVIDNDLYQAGRTADYSNAGTGTIYHNNRTTTGWVP